MARLRFLGRLTSVQGQCPGLDVVQAHCQFRWARELFMALATTLTACLKSTLPTMLLARGCVSSEGEVKDSSVIADFASSIATAQFGLAKKTQGYIAALAKSLNPASSASDRAAARQDMEKHDVYEDFVLALLVSGTA